MKLPSMSGAGKVGISWAMDANAVSTPRPGSPAYKHTLGAPASAPVITTGSFVRKNERTDNAMPVQVIIQQGRRMYRWGDQGRIYPTREQAQRQGQAAYAAGYRENKDNK